MRFESHDDALGEASAKREEAIARNQSMSHPVRSSVIHLADAGVRIPGPPGQHFINVLQRGTVRLLLSFPLNPNQQAPHEQDEIYVIVRGSGVLFHDGRRDDFRGEVLARAW